MDNLKPDELAAEQAAIQAPKEDDIRSSVIEEYGFDPDADGERIDKLVAKEVENHRKLSAAIGQKIKHRQEAEELRKNVPSKKELPPKEEGLSERDIFALVKANVSEDDIDEVKGYASYKKISVAEALKDKTLNSILSDRSEERRSAEVANTRSARGTSKPSGETLISKAKEGILPDKDEDIEALAEAEMQAKMKKK